mmetsp:Transcript_6277/g.15921  ORF Transcript_6277/g.15921 Transcript_6277/m.15921 type:complete len:223 (+) Transcript_6277:965-1633(+)
MRLAGGHDGAPPVHRIQERVQLPLPADRRRAAVDVRVLGRAILQPRGGAARPEPGQAGEEAAQGPGLPVPESHLCAAARPAAAGRHQRVQVQGVLQVLLILHHPADAHQEKPRQRADPPAARGHYHGAEQPGERQHRARAGVLCDHGVPRGPRDAVRVPEGAHQHPEPGRAAVRRVRGRPRGQVLQAHGADAGGRPHCCAGAVRRHGPHRRRSPRPNPCALF